MSRNQQKNALVGKSDESQSATRAECWIAYAEAEQMGRVVNGKLSAGAVAAQRHLKRAGKRAGKILFVMRCACYSHTKIEVGFSVDAQCVRRRAGR